MAEGEFHIYDRKGRAIVKPDDLGVRRIIYTRGGGNLPSRTTEQQAISTMPETIKYEFNEKFPLRNGQREKLEKLGIDDARVVASVFAFTELDNQTLSGNEKKRRFRNFCKNLGLDDSQTNNIFLELGQAKMKFAGMPLKQKLEGSRSSRRKIRSG